MLSIFIKDSFDSAHFLPNVPRDHKCASLHGHTYRIRIDISGTVDELLGWIVDYATVKTVWEPIKAMLDHKTLNDTLPNPTCELIALWIKNKFDQGLPPQARLARLELRETASSGVVLVI